MRIDFSAILDDINDRSSRAIRFKPIVDSIKEAAVGNAKKLDGYYDEIPEEGDDDFHPAPELKPGLEDDILGTSIEL